MKAWIGESRTDYILPHEDLFFVALSDGEIKPGDSGQAMPLVDGTCTSTPPEALKELTAARK